MDKDNQTTEKKTKQKKPVNILFKYHRIVLGLFFLIAFWTSYWIWLDYRNFVKQPIEFNAEQQRLVIERGMGVNRLASQLHAQGLIKRPIYLKILAYLKPEYKQIKVGEYQLGQRMKPEQLLTQLSEGNVIQYAFTIVEGQTIYQVLDNLSDEKDLKQLKINEPIDLLHPLEIESTSPEGWLFPETYYFIKGDTAIDLLKRATKAMKLALMEEWQDRAAGLPYQSPYEALIMASIIEKETAIPEERDEIAGVFVRRLQKKMRLQTDPTVIYGIGPDFNGDITRKDLKTPTAYNTYVIKGLPPTPIAMPSRASIHAALHPAPGSSLYFVADGTGGHYFSETLEEHQLAVKRMLKRLRENKSR